MNPSLEQLVNLCDIDKKIDSYNPQIAEINKKIEEKQQVIVLLTQQQNELESSITKLEALILDTNRQIAEQGEKIKKLSSRSASLKKEREITATQSEESITKEQLVSLNEDIEKNEKAIEIKNADLKELRGKIQEANKALQSTKSEVAAELQNIEDSKKDLYRQKDELLRKINQKVLGFYEKIRKWAKNTAVVPMRKQACYGCFMRLNDKTLSEVLFSDEITTCPHCGRILYNEKTEIITEPITTKKTTTKKSTTKKTSTSKKATTKKTSASKTTTKKTTTKSKSSE